MAEGRNLENRKIAISRDDADGWQHSKEHMVRMYQQLRRRSFLLAAEVQE